MLAFSTSWNADGRLTPTALLTTISAFGIDAIELSYQHTEEDVTAISASCRSMGMEIVSVHNFCPRPAIPDRGRSLSEILLLSSLEEAERQAAIEATRRSIDTAAASGARALILHLGRVEIPSLTRELVELYRCGREDSKTYREMLNRMVKARAERAGPYFEKVLMSLDELCPDAARAGVSLAVENRFYHREIPSLDECREIMERFRTGPISYWHDVGHAQIMEDLGFCRHEDYLETAGERLCGFHIHDVLRCQDHLPPSYGTVDFSRFKKYWRRRPVVIELSPSSDAVSVARGVERARRELYSS
jgi:sugar phosphate isomerase/epimerase